MKDNNTHNRKFSEWLENLQQESWQLELLISGFVIFGLFAAKPYINEVTNFLIATDDRTLFIGAVISASLPLAWYVFVSNLIIHVFVRGLWIGSVGLRYVSGDIDYDELNYSKIFTDYYKEKYGSFDNFIENLEKISSIIFSVTFLIFFIFLSTLIYFGLFIYLGNQIFDSDTFILFRIIGTIFFVALLLSGLFIVFDFFTIGGLKRIKNRFFSNLYFRLNKLTSTVTLASLWRPLLLNFLDHKFSRMVFILSLPYALLVSIFLPNMFIQSNVYHPDFKQDTPHEKVIAKESYNFKYYEDELVNFYDDTQDIGLEQILIPSKKITGQIMQVFVKAHPLDGLLIKHLNSESSPLYVTGLKNEPFESFKRGFNSSAFSSDSIKQDQESKFTANFKSIKRTLTNVMEFSINNETLSREKVQCDFYMHPINQTKGMLCIITLDSLSEGRNTFTFKRLTGNDSEQKPMDETSLSIPFIYEK